MTEVKYIQKDEQLDPSMDYEFLRSYGIRMIQHLAGEKWTDYNIHDPGVTILEQVCYALSELGYRAGMDITDLLADGLHDEEKEDDSFFSARRILPSNPVTLVDYQKMIIDRVPRVKSAWVQPIQDSGGKNEISGLFIVLVEPEDEIYNSPNRDEQFEEIRKETWKVIKRYDNLCEDFEEVVVLKPMSIGVSADVVLNQDADVDIVHANVLFHLELFLAPRIPFHSLDELQRAGMPVNEIFNGPLLTHGFILDEDLYEKPTVIFSSQIIQKIREVKDVESIQNLDLKPDDSLNGGILIDFDKVPRLDKEHYQSVKGVHLIRYIKHGIVFKANPKRFNRYLDELKSKYQQSLKQIASGNMDLPIPKGVSNNVEGYYSIQNQFPKTYGIGEKGVPSSYPERRKAQARQLKGYLVLFEQIMANYLSQLANVSEFFSLDNTIKRTYYFQTLEGKFPQSEDLLKGIKPKTPQSAWQEINDDPSDHYKKVQQISRNSENYYDRRHRTLNHLMARFGERFMKFSLSRFNYYYTDEEYKDVLMDIKSDFIRNYPEISRNRFRSFDPTQKFWGTDNISGLEKRIRAVLGINNPIRSIAEIVNDEKIYLKHRTDEDPDFDFDHPILDEDLINRQFRRIPVDITQEELDDDCTDCEDYGFMIGEELFEAGFKLDNYRIGPSSLGAGFLIAFRNCAYDPEVADGRDYRWKKIGEFKTKGHAISEVRKLVKRIKELNIRSEGVYIVEHVLFRPRREEDSFRILIKGKGEYSDTTFQSQNLYTFADLQAGVMKIAQAARTGTISIEQQNEKYKLHFLDNNGVEVDQLLNQYDDEQEAHDAADRLKRMFEDLNDIDLHSREIVRLTLSHYGGIEVEGDFYSFRVSVLFPNWPARFKDDNFREWLKRSIMQSAPAHVGIRFHWEDFRFIRDFEQRYSPWLDAMQNRDTISVVDLNSRAFNLMEKFHSSTSSEGSSQFDLIRQYLALKQEEMRKKGGGAHT